MGSSDHLFYIENEDKPYPIISISLYEKPIDPGGCLSTTIQAIDKCEQTMIPNVISTDMWCVLIPGITP